MTAPAITVNLSAQIDSTSGPVSIGTMLVPVNGLYVVATPANRALGGRAHGIALTAWGTATPGAVRLQHVGVVDSAITGLGVGAASWVRVSATGTAERCTPAGSDDVIGWCWTDGTLMMLCGLLTAAIVNGSGGGGSTTTTGTGFWHNTAGALDAAATALTFTGDTTGTGTAASIALTTVKVNGATVPAGGALTTGNLLAVTGAGALGYGPLNLAGGANFVTGVLPAANQGAQTLAGDATGLTSATVVVKVNGASVPAAGALTTGNAAYVSGASALTYSALNLAGGAGWVTGVLPSANVASHAGDVTGAHTATVVAKINGATVPAAGALTSGNSLYVTGASALSYSALNLAGGSGWVTGALPLANLAVPDWTALGYSVTLATLQSYGWSGSSTITQGAGAPGATPANGSLFLRTDGTGATGLYTRQGGAWRAVGANLGRTSTAIGYTVLATDQLVVCTAASITITLPLSPADTDRYTVANIAAGTVTVSGNGHNINGAASAALSQYQSLTFVYDSAEAIWIATTATVSSAASAGGSGQVQASDGAGAFTAPTNILAGTNFVSIGATPSTTGSGVRLANTEGIYTRNGGNSADLPTLVTDSGNAVTVCGGTGALTAAMGALEILTIKQGSSILMRAYNTNVTAAQPIIGEALESSPFGVHGKTTVATTGSFSVAAADYALDTIWFTGGTAGTITFPLPASDAKAYTKKIINTSGVTKTLSNGGATTMVFNSGNIALVLFDTAGVHLSAASTAWV